MTQPRVDTASRLIKASPMAIYGALTNAGDLAAWLPPSGMTGEVLAFEPREGGRFRLVLTYLEQDYRGGKSTGNSDVVKGRFAKLVPGECVAWLVDFESDDPSFAGTMTMTWRFAPAGDATEVTITAENVPAGIRPEDHAAGMDSSLANLAKYVEEHE